jgi:hypothetical protein
VDHHVAGRKLSFPEEDDQPPLAFLTSHNSLDDLLGELTCRANSFMQSTPFPPVVIFFIPFLYFLIFLKNLISFFVSLLYTLFNFLLLTPFSDFCSSYVYCPSTSLRIFFLRFLASFRDFFYFYLLLFYCLLF